MAKELTEATPWKRTPDGVVVTGAGKELVAMTEQSSDGVKKRNALCKVFNGDGVSQRVVVQWGAAAEAPTGVGEETVAFAKAVATGVGKQSALQVRVRALAEQDEPPEVGGG